MAQQSDIQWTDATWPIVQGCDPYSPGCANCYVPKELIRMAGNPNPKISGPVQGLAERYVNASGQLRLRFTGKIALRHDRLDWPLTWKKPQMIFVPSHGDLFHKDVPDEFIDKVFAAMILCPQHRFQVLTKRAVRLHQYMTDRGCDLPDRSAGDGPRSGTWTRIFLYGATTFGRDRFIDVGPTWPPKNVWLGVSCEDQANADERIPHLLNTPAAIRFVSLEPLLAPINLTSIFDHSNEHAIDALSGRRYHAPQDDEGVPEGRLDWIIDGGESGPDDLVRDYDIDASRAIEAQCVAAGVPFFRKQLGRKPFEREPSAWPQGYPHGDGSITLMPDGFGRYAVSGFKHKKAGDPAEWPADLRRREFPRVPSLTPKENSDAADHRHSA